jgi:hypothetical protein
VRCARNDTKHEAINGTAMLDALYPIRSVMIIRVKQNVNMEMMQRVRTNA